MHISKIDRMEWVGGKGVFARKKRTYEKALGAIVTLLVKMSFAILVGLYTYHNLHVVIRTHPSPPWLKHRENLSLTTQVRMCLGILKVRQMRIEEAATTLLQALQRGFCVRNVRATAISKIHDRAWHAARGERDARVRVRARGIRDGEISSQRYSFRQGEKDRQ